MPRFMVSSPIMLFCSFNVGGESFGSLYNFEVSRFILFIFC